MHYYTTNNTTTQKRPFGHRNSLDSLLDCTIPNPYHHPKISIFLLSKQVSHPCGTQIFDAHAYYQYPGKWKKATVTHYLSEKRTIFKQLKNPNGIPPPSLTTTPWKTNCLYTSLAFNPCGTSVRMRITHSLLPTYTKYTVSQSMRCRGMVGSGAKKSSTNCIIL